MESKALGLGSKVRIKQPWQPTSDWEITLFEDRKRFAWETRRAGLRMEATHILEPHGGGTKNILRLEVSGIFSWCLYPLLSDFNKEVAARYGALYDDYFGMKGVAKRAAFLIDEEGIIQYREVLEDSGKLHDLKTIQERLAKMN